MTRLALALGMMLFALQARAATWTTPQLQGGTDSTAIQAAVDTGLDVYFEGTFSVDSTITITSKTGQSLWGPGKFVLQAGRPLGTQIFNVDTANNITFRYLEFDGNKANQTQPPDDNTWNTGLPRAYFTAIDMAHSSNVTIENCEFYDVTTTSVNFYDSRNVQLRLNSFHDSYMDAMFTNLEDGIINVNFDILIERNTIRDLTYRDAEGEIVNRYANGLIVNADDLVVRWNHIDTVDRTGLKPTDDERTNILIENNTIIDPGWAGINPQGGSNITIRDNTITDAGTIGISITNAEPSEVRSNITIEDNVITSAGYNAPVAGAKAGMLLSGNASDVTVSGNTITDCNRFGIYILDVDDSTINDNVVSGSNNYNVYIAGDVSDFSDTVTLQDNTITGSVYGIRFEEYAEDFTITGGTVSGASASGIYLGTPDGTEISGVTIEEITANGIWIASATNTLVDNNTISDIVNSGVLLSGDPNPDVTTISNNDFDTITQYGINIPGGATNVTIPANNTFNNIGIDDINWPEEP
jgi:parallel beta-helix repeat protein